MTDISVSLSALLIVISLTLVALSLEARMPWSMIGGTIGGLLMAMALLVDALEPGHDSDAALTLRFMAAIVLAASVWTFYSHRRRQRKGTT